MAKQHPVNTQASESHSGRALARSMASTEENMSARSDKEPREGDYARSRHKRPSVPSNIRLDKLGGL